MELEEGPLVLLVEDDRDGRRMYAEWLTHAGFQVDDAVLPKPCSPDNLEAAVRSLMDARPGASRT